MASFDSPSASKPTATSFLEQLHPRIEATKALALSYSIDTGDATDTAGWEQCWHKHDITASKRCMDGNQICVRGQTSYPQSPLEVFKVIQNIVELDDVMKQHDVLAKLSPSVVIDHVFIDTPWPVTPRDGLSATFVEVEENGAIFQVSFGIKNDEVCAPIDGVIRSELAISAFVLLPDEQGGTKATYVLQMDPMGSIPSFLKSKMTSSKPMLLHRVRAALNVACPSPISTSSSPPATAEEVLDVFNMKPITAL